MHNSALTISAVIFSASHNISGFTTFLIFDYSAISNNFRPFGPFTLYLTFSNFIPIWVTSSMRMNI